jgi:pimeloyl-ACP methyl ester carboxylesterase
LSPPLVLLHEAVGDSRMWDVNDFGGREVLAPDLRGFGGHPYGSGPFSRVEDVVALLDSEGIDTATLIGASLGGRVALEITLSHSERVVGLVLAAPGLRGWDWSEEFQEYGRQEEELFEAGDVDGVVELNLRMWVEGPTRGPGDVDPGLRARVAEMQRLAVEHDLAAPDAGPERELQPPARKRLGEVSVPTLVVVGTLDIADMHEIARELAAGIPGARLEWIEGVAHVLNMEKPREFDRIVVEFLDSAGL